MHDPVFILSLATFAGVCWVVAQFAPGWRKREVSADEDDELRAALSRISPEGDAPFDLFAPSRCAWLDAQDLEFGHLEDFLGDLARLLEREGASLSLRVDAPDEHGDPVEGQWQDEPFVLVPSGIPPFEDRRDDYVYCRLSRIVNRSLEASGSPLRLYWHIEDGSAAVLLRRPVFFALRRTSLARRLLDADDGGAPASPVPKGIGSPETKKARPGP